jgi:hypothetical protein
MKDDNYYKELYEKFILTRQERSLNESNIIEIHHILPRCLGGSDEDNNLIKLTAREHFLAHLLLHRAYPNHIGLKKALAAMFKGDKRQQKNRSFNSRFYQLIREKIFVKCPSRKDLEEMYIIDKMSYAKIAKKYNVSDMTVCKWMKLREISPRLSSDYSYDIPPKQIIIDFYVKKQFPYNELQTMYNCKPSLIHKWATHYGLNKHQVRGVNSMQRIPSKEEIEKCIVLGKRFKTTDSICKRFNCGRPTALKWLKSYDLSI